MRKILSLFIVLSIAFVMVACDAGGDPAEKENAGDSNTEASSTEDNGDDSAYEEETLETFESLLAHFEESGLELGEVKVNEKATAETVGADSGVILAIDGIDAQLYHFEDQESEEYQQAVESNTITIDFEGQGVDLAVYAHGGFGGLDIEYHVAGDEIMAALDSYEE